MADAWGGSWGSSWGSSWGAGGSPPVVAPATATVGGGRGRRRVIIDEVIYEGTDEQIEAHLQYLLGQREPEQPQTKPVRKRKPKKQAVGLSAAYVPAPVYIDMSRYERFVQDTYRYEDAFTRGMLKKLLERYQEDEDDIEVLLLAL